MVLDSSATLAWLYRDEVSDGIRRIFDLISTDGAWVPFLWRLEVANGLQTGIRRRRIDASYRSAALADLSGDGSFVTGVELFVDGGRAQV